MLRGKTYVGRLLVFVVDADISPNKFFSDVTQRSAKAVLKSNIFK